MSEPSKAESQSDKFKRLARELECDESEEAFDDALKRVATAPPPDADEKPEEKKPAK